jgi:hypothetical protein
MYHDDFLRIPTDTADMWAVLRDHFEQIEGIFFGYGVETRAEALSGEYRKGPHKGAMQMVRYRNVHPDYDNREYFYELAHEFLPLVARDLEEESLSPAFVQRWGVLMYCHGYIASYIFDDSDDLQPQRAGAVRTRDLHRKWVAATMLPFIDDRGLTRREAEERTVALIHEIQRTGKYPEGFDKYSFSALLSGNNLVSSYTQKRVSVEGMREWLNPPKADDSPESG